MTKNFLATLNPLPYQWNKLRNFPLDYLLEKELLFNLNSCNTFLRDSASPKYNTSNTYSHAWSTRRNKPSIFHYQCCQVSTVFSISKRVGHAILPCTQQLYRKGPVIYPGTFQVFQWLGCNTSWGYWRIRAGLKIKLWVTCSKISCKLQREEKTAPTLRHFQSPCERTLYRATSTSSRLFAKFPITEIGIPIIIGILLGIIYKLKV